MDRKSREVSAGLTLIYGDEGEVSLSSSVQSFKDFGLGRLLMAAAQKVLFHDHETI